MDAGQHSLSAVWVWLSRAYVEIHAWTINANEYRDIFIGDINIMIAAFHLDQRKVRKDILGVCRCFFRSYDEILDCIDEQNWEGFQSF